MSHLELDRQSGGLRHFLEGKAVHAGSTLELKLEDGQWIAGRYEWNFQGDSLPRFYLGLAGEPPGPPSDEGALLLPTWAILRWPNKTGKK